MELIKACKGYDADAEFVFSQLVFSCEDELIYAICIEANELRLLVNSEKSIDDILEEIEAGDGHDFHITVENADGQTERFNQTIEIEALLTYFIENDVEHYQCWKADLGDEGLCEAEESEAAIPLFMAYDFLRNASVEHVFQLMQESKSDDFFEIFDRNCW